MLETGFLDSEAIAAILAGHLHPELEVGHLGFAPAASNAASDTINLRLIGRGGHGAQPQLCIDPIVAGAHLVTQLQTIISRSLAATDSAVLAIGRFQAGTHATSYPGRRSWRGPCGRSIRWCGSGSWDAWKSW